MPSIALTALGSRLADIDQLMKAHVAVGGNKRGRRFEVVALNRASVLLLSAHLEGYLEELLAEALASVHADLDAAVVTGRFANPSTGNIDGLYRVLGIAKCTDQISWRNAANTAVKRNINDLVGLRNRLAHGAHGVTVYKYEVERYRRYVVGFSGKLDELVADRVQTMTGSRPWLDTAREPSAIIGSRERVACGFARPGPIEGLPRRQEPLAALGRQEFALRLFGTASETRSAVTQPVPSALVPPEFSARDGIPPQAVLDGRGWHRLAQLCFQLSLQDLGRDGL